MEAADLARNWQKGHGDPERWSRRAQVRTRTFLEVVPLVYLLQTVLSNASSSSQLCNAARFQGFALNVYDFTCNGRNAVAAC
jgi:hypothetical protein